MPRKIDQPEEPTPTFAAEPEPSPPPDTPDGILGFTFRAVVVAGGRKTLILRPLSRAQQWAIATTQSDENVDTELRVFWMAAQRGGYTGTEAEFAQLVEGDDLIRMAAKLEEMTPLSIAAGRKLAGLPAVETGTELSGSS